MKVLVTGANGLLGQHLVKELLEKKYTVTATGKGPSRLPFAESATYHYTSADLTDGSAVYELLAIEGVDVIVHAGAITQLDECELNQDACFEVNVRGTAELLVAAEVYPAFFIYISTDFVFDGELGNYAEDAHINPVSWYGFTKVQAESTVETSETPWAIIRTCLVYGNTFSGTRTNIVGWVKDSLEAGKEIKVVSDQVRTPTFVEDLVTGILLVIEKQATGIFHIAGKDVLTPYDMALATANVFHLDPSLISKADASNFTQPAKRPLKTGFDITKARRELGFEPTDFKAAMEKIAATISNNPGD